VFDQDTEEQRVIRNEGHSGGRGFSALLCRGEGRGDAEVPSHGMSCTADMFSHKMNFTLMPTKTKNQ